MPLAKPNKAVKAKATKKKDVAKKTEIKSAPIKEELYILDLAAVLNNGTEADEVYVSNKGTTMGKFFKLKDKTPYTFALAILKTIEGAGLYFKAAPKDKDEVKYIYRTAMDMVNKQSDTTMVVFGPEVKKLIEDGLQDTTFLYRLLQIEEGIIKVKDTGETIKDIEELA